MLNGFWLASLLQRIRNFREEKSIFHTRSNEIENAICEIYLLSEFRKHPLFE